MVWFNNRPTVILDVKADEEAMMDDTIRRCITLAQTLKVKVRVTIGKVPHDRIMIVDRKSDVIRTIDIYSDTIGMK